MELKEIRMFQGRVLVEVVPSHEGGVFVGRFGHVENVGKLAVLSGITLDDSLDLGAGDKDVLDQYLHTDKENPGTYVFINGCRGSIRMNASESAGITDGVIQEFAPYVPKLVET